MCISVIRTNLNFFKLCESFGISRIHIDQKVVKLCFFAIALFYRLYCHSHRIINVMAPTDIEPTRASARLVAKRQELTCHESSYKRVLEKADDNHDKVTNELLPIERFLKSLTNPKENGWFQITAASRSIGDSMEEDKKKKVGNKDRSEGTFEIFSKVSIYEAYQKALRVLMCSHLKGSTTMTLIRIAILDCLDFSS